VEGGITFAEILDISPAFSDASVLSDLNHGTSSAICKGPDSHGIIVNNDTMLMYTFDVPAGTPDGLYAIDITYASLTQEDSALQYDGVAVKRGYIQVGDSVTPPATTTKPAATTTTGNQQTTAATTAPAATTTTTVTSYKPADGNAAWVIPEVHGKRGEKVTLNVYVSGDSDLAVSGAEFKIAADSVFGKPTATGSEAYDSALEYNKDRNEYAFGQNAGKGIVAKNDAVILSIEYTVPTDIEAGTYPVTWSDLFVSDTNGLEITDKVEAVAGAIIIDPVYDGEMAWKIPDVPAKPGETVTLDVIVKDTDNAAIPVAGAQFKITADTAEFVSVDKNTAAYDAAIENNPKTNEFAFGQDIGKGVAAKDGDTVLTLTYTAPTAPGVYPIKWSEAFISDTNGNELTNITLLDGSITVADVPVAEGEVSWVIKDVEAAPGDTVTMEVKVEDSSNPGLAVAGAQFAINADTPIVYDGSVGSDAYDAELIDNAKTNEFAFAQKAGNGTAAKDNDNVLLLTYKVPDDCKEGDYNVKWSDAFISDTNGNDITSKVKLVPGVIHVTAKTTTTTSAPTTTAATTTAATTTTTVTAASGHIIWQVDTVEVDAGETVTVNVKVIDEGNTKLPVGGAQFVVKAETPIGHGES
ncbi:MAG: hypothetical protein K2K14_02555, partial [Ruminococcus sp.]|nr:hypothetical protein [Ruminococcus sp.]